MVKIKEHFTIENILISKLRNSINNKLIEKN